MRIRQCSSVIYHMYLSNLFLLINLIVSNLFRNYRRFEFLIVFSFQRALFSRTPGFSPFQFSTETNVPKMNTVETAKKKACELAVQEWLGDDQAVGVGSGSTIEYAVAAIAQRVAMENLKIQCVPTSFQAKQLLVKYNLPISSLDVCEELDVAFDGADEVDSHLRLIKGGGGCLLQEKIVAACASNFIVLVDERKCSKNLGTRWTKGLPIEVVPMAYKPVQTKIEKLYGGEAVLRQAIAKSGPVVTDNGNFILDWKFDSSKQYLWSEVESGLFRLPGVIETGLFIGMTRKVYIGKLDGTIQTWD